MEATISSKNQATIPKSVRDYLNLKPGDRFKFFLQPDGTVVMLSQNQNRNPQGLLAPTEAARLGRGGDERGH